MFSSRGSSVIRPCSLARPPGLAGPSVDPVTPSVRMTSRGCRHAGLSETFWPGNGDGCYGLLQTDKRNRARERAPAWPEGAGNEGGWRRSLRSVMAWIIVFPAGANNICTELHILPWKILCAEPYPPGLITSIG
ncbi:hypothetical protein D9X30_3152 [Cupriavidus sp. U2]|nr:hypothetical protein D9X30_3152 [Cupriavidus sp. U2]